jgi:hypothetical protein
MRRLWLCATTATLVVALSAPADARRHHRHSNGKIYGYARVDEAIGLRQGQSQDRADKAARADDAPGPQGWTQYVNRDGGTAFDHPANVFSVKDGAPEKGTGERFRTADGRAQLTVYALPNPDGDSPRSYLDRHLMIDRGKLDYGTVTDRFFAISGIREERTFYSRCNFVGAPRGTMHCIYLEYPAAETRAWDAVVTRISRSLHAAGGENAQR